jgi:amino acid permease
VEKDTLTFALLLSVIDFFLSMVMITGIGLILYLLPKLNRLGTLDEESMRRGH